MLDIGFVPFNPHFILCCWVSHDVGNVLSLFLLFLFCFPFFFFFWVMFATHQTAPCAPKPRALSPSYRFGTTNSVSPNWYVLNTVSGITLPKSISTLSLSLFLFLFFCSIVSFFYVFFCTSSRLLYFLSNLFASWIQYFTRNAFFMCVWVSVAFLFSLFSVSGYMIYYFICFRLIWRNKFRIWIERRTKF